MTGAAPDQGRPLRVLTVPNALSALRLLGVPLFLWLVLARHADIAAFVVLAVSSVTDYLDGLLARVLRQFSRLGEVLDPVADRLYIAALVVALTLRHIVPWWLLFALVGRDVVLSGLLPLLRRHGYGPFAVHFVGKAATYNLLYGLPLLLLSVGHGALSTVVRPVGWAFTIWGSALYEWAGVLYVVQVRQLVAADEVPPAGAPADRVPVRDREGSGR